MENKGSENKTLKEWLLHSAAKESEAESRRLEIRESLLADGIKEVTASTAATDASISSIRSKLEELKSSIPQKKILMMYENLDMISSQNEELRTNVEKQLKLVNEYMTLNPEKTYAVLDEKVSGLGKRLDDHRNLIYGIIIVLLIQIFLLIVYVIPKLPS